MSAHVTEIQQLLALTGAVLGGFSFTFFVAVLAGGGKSRLTGIVAGLALASALCLLLTTFCGALKIPLSLGFSSHSAGSSVSRQLLTDVTVVAFSIGMTLLVISIGAAGWLRSRLLGLVASSLATLVLATMAYAAWALWHAG